ncbi:MAG: 23S rRNA (guanosine(2251)-2'-O)-methyltransferase RlmB [Gammaproteobacteria bacterium]|nr:23S rRNA (guanosine(2251)-2'-O)-methyltransferase RlmB [Pseudomonadota bacterium]MCH9664062.1 23S rRNA (guanosine(2251)-2'-O)-methyltransferase RlmB [Gammaproteobacteria bacterium]
MSNGERQDSIVYGIHSVQAVLKRRAGDVRRLYIDKDATRRLGVVLKLARLKKVVVEEVDAPVLRRMAEGGVHQGIVAACIERASRYGIEDLCGDLARLQRPPLILILDRLSDPGNLGACLRSAAAFGVDAVVTTEHHSSGLTSTARKAAAGAAEALTFLSVASLGHTLDQLTAAINFQLVASVADTEPDSIPPDAVEMTGRPLALIVGGEQGGVRNSVVKRCDYSVHIPMSDQMDCLNVSAACSILLYEIARQRRATGLG